MEPIKNIISCPIKNVNTEPNCKFNLEKYFKIAYSNQATILTLAILFGCNYIQIIYSQSLLWNLSPNLPNFLNPSHFLNTLIPP